VTDDQPQYVGVTRAKWIPPSPDKNPLASGPEDSESIAISFIMGNCNAPGYFLQITKGDSVDTGLAGKADVPTFITSIISNLSISYIVFTPPIVFRKTVLFF
jgi:hypothetical protein